MTRWWKSRPFSRQRKRIALVTSVAMLAGGAAYVFDVPAMLDGKSEAPALQDWGGPAKGRDGKVRPRDRGGWGGGKPVDVIWPTADRVEIPVTAAASSAKVGGMPVTARSAATGSSGPVSVQTFDRKTSTDAGAEGVLLTVSGENQDVRLEADYSDFAAGYGGAYGSRLRWHRAPRCDARSPEPGCANHTEPLDTTNDGEQQTASATVRASQNGGVYALAADSDSSQGTYKATALSPSSSWSVSGATGGFTWSYPIETVDTPGDMAPSIGLSYTSQDTDGRTAATNNQGSWIGEGFTYEPGYIERRYKPCTDDGHSSSGDLCWAWNNATVMLEGRAGKLVKDGDMWRLSSDDGSIVERLTNTNNSDNNNEYWKLTTTDGTQYFFGRSRLPGWASGDEATDSVWTVPVFGDDAGEPCHGSTFAGSSCYQAWRWNLDYVVDTYGNVISYFYNKEKNHYSRGGRTDVNGAPYTRGGYLERIDYGQRSDSIYSTPAATRVRFTVAERCIPSAEISCQPDELNDDTAQHWPDVPWDLNCKADTKCGITRMSPSFWTRKRLTGITTEIRSGTGWSKVSSWDLDHVFVTNGDSSRSLWLHKIARTGHLGGTVTLPSTELLGVQMANRVDKVGDSISPFVRPRLATVYTDTGGQVDVTYSDQDCAPGDTPTPASNTRRCYPVKWQPPSYDDKITDWFHKYVVDEVTVSDRTGGSPAEVTRYEYLGDPAWRRTKPDGITKQKDLTWADWRGYQKVRVIGAPNTTLATRTEQTYFRGMHGDDNGSGGTRSVSITDSTGATHADHDELAGELLESVTYNGMDVVFKGIASQWRHVTAKASYSWGALRSTFVRPETVRQFVALESGGWRETKAVNAYDTTYGRAVEIDDLGDLTTAADDRCTRAEYADNASRNLVSFLSRSETVAVRCSVTPDRSQHVLADDRMFYDGGGFGVSPTRGDVTRTEELLSHNGLTATYVSLARTEYDTYGRVTKLIDPLNRETTSTYTETDGLTTTMVVTNPLGHTATSHYDPAISEPTSVIDANGRRTSLAYDPMGRVSAVWLANRDKARGQSPNLRFGYQVRDDAPVAVKTESLKNDGTYRPSYQLFDGWLRSRQTQVEGPGGGRLVTDTFYDALGRSKRTNDTYHAEGPPGDALLVVADGEVNGQTTNVYDNAGRVAAVVFSVSGQEKWRTVKAYGGDRVHVTPPAGGTPTTRIVDARGNTVELRQYHGGAPTGGYDATTYSYTPRGELETVVDQAGNTWSYRYDPRGRRIREVDPDSGTSVTRYDVLGRITSTTDARQVTLSYEYDALDRKKAVYHGDNPLTRVKLAEWFWDLYDKGKLAGSRSYDGDLQLTQVINTRDALYRPTRQTYTLGGTGAGLLAGSYQFNVGYNLDGTVKGTTFPAAGGLAGEGVLFSYDDLGRVTKVDGDRVYAGDLAYSPTGLLAQVGLFAGAKRSWLTFQHEKGTNRLTRTHLDSEGITGTLNDTHYRYDPAGNLTSIIDEPTAAGGQRDAQCFTYDYLRRLTEAWTTAAGGDGGTACAGGPEATGVGGPAAYWHEYTIDTAGNRTRMTAHATGAFGAPTEDLTREYSYPLPGTEGPHRLRQVTERTASGEVSHGFGYDDAGNTISRPGPSGTAQTLTWDPQGQLASVTEDQQSTSYAYDSEGNRYLRRDADGVTLYLPGVELRQPAGGGSVEATRYYDLPGGVSYVRTSGDAQYQVADHHGTGTLALDPDTAEVTQRRSDPYGNPRGPQPDQGSWAGERGFVGGTQDATGLTHLGAREYDPVTGRFISVDPIIDPADPQQMHGYAYANNSPVSFSDPDGLVFFGDADGNYRALPKSGGGYKFVGGPGKKKKKKRSSARTQVERAQDKLRKARARQAALKRKLANAGKLLLDILMEVTGARAGIDCFTKGDVGGCLETAVSVLSGLAGGLVAKIGVKYAFRWKAAARLIGKVKKLVGDVINVVRKWSKRSRDVRKAKRRLAAAKARAKRAKERSSTSEERWKDRQQHQELYETEDVLRGGSGRGDTSYATGKAAGPLLKSSHAMHKEVSAGTVQPVSGPGVNPPVGGLAAGESIGIAIALVSWAAWRGAGALWRGAAGRGVRGLWRAARRR